jgi:rhodanese-related sulfurtransferase
MNGKRGFRWTRNRALAAAALLLGLLALAGNPYRGRAVTLHTDELATLVGTQADHVGPGELAGWIVQGAFDYRLVDLRPEKDYAAYHIPTAECVPMEELDEAGLARNEKIVLYSDGVVHAAQAWMLLKAQGYAGVYILSGGLDDWKDQVLYPVAPDSTAGAAERAGFERAAQLSRFFGGAPRAAAQAAAGATLALPTPSAPEAVAPQGSLQQAPRLGAPSGGAPPGRAGKKKKEGC